MSKYQLIIIRLFVEIIRVVTVCASAANDATKTKATITNILFILFIIVLRKTVGAVKLVTKIYCLPVFVKTDRLRPHS
jgi:hypothetical protein